VYSFDGILAFGLLFICTCAYFKKVPRLNNWLLSEKKGVWGVFYKGISASKAGDTLHDFQRFRRHDPPSPISGCGYWNTASHCCGAFLFSHGLLHCLPKMIRGITLNWKRTEWTRDGLFFCSYVLIHVVGDLPR
ncbi:unnamed protein product, partial [Tetraodon nigroviridis]